MRMGKGKLWIRGGQARGYSKKVSIAYIHKTSLLALGQNLNRQYSKGLYFSILTVLCITVQALLVTPTSWP